MSPLAQAIYAILWLRVPSDDGRISYTDLVEALPAEHGIASARDRRLDRAYGEIVRACRRRQLTPLVALVVHFENGRLTQPGNGYFEETHPGVTDPEQRTALWAADWEIVRRTTYPEVIE